VLFWISFHDDERRADSENAMAGSNSHAATTADAAENQPSTLAIMQSGAVWALIAQQFFRCSPFVFFSALFPMFLQQHRGMNLRDSGLLSSLPLFATLLGCLASGAITDLLLYRNDNQLASRRTVAIVGLFLAAASILSALWFTNPITATLVMSVGTFGAAFAGVAAFTASMDVGHGRVGTVFGLMNTAGNIGGAISPIIAGEIIVRTGNWNIIVVLCASLYLASMASWMVLGSASAAPQESLSTPPKSNSSESGLISMESGNVRC
jgi:nitrate/nitrite transporter NarK